MKSSIITVVRTQTLEVEVEHDEGARPYEVKSLAITKARLASDPEWDESDLDVI